MHHLEVNKEAFILHKCERLNRILVITAYVAAIVQSAGLLLHILFIILLLSKFDTSRLCINSSRREDATRWLIRVIVYVCYVFSGVCIPFFQYHASSLYEIKPAYGIPPAKQMIKKTAKYLKLDCLLVLSSGFFIILYWCATETERGLTRMFYGFIMMLVTTYARVMIDYSTHLSKNIPLLVSLGLASILFYCEVKAWARQCDTDLKSTTFILLLELYEFSLIITSIGALRFAYYKVRRIHNIQHTSYYDVDHTVLHENYLSPMQQQEQLLQLSQYSNDDKS